MKIYLAIKGSSLEDAETQIANFKEKVMEIINEKLNQNINKKIAIIIIGDSNFLFFRKLYLWTICGEVTLEGISYFKKYCNRLMHSS